MSWPSSAASSSISTACSEESAFSGSARSVSTRACLPRSSASCSSSRVLTAARSHIRSFLHMRTPSTDGRAKGAQLQRAGGSGGLLQALICGEQLIASALHGCLYYVAAILTTRLSGEAILLAFVIF